MSWWASNRWPHYSKFPVAKYFVALGLVAIALLALLPSEPLVRANPPIEKDPARPAAGQSPEIDDRSPLPGANQEIASKLPIPNPDRAIFAGRKDLKGNLEPGTGIVDFDEIASEKKNPDEYQAWHEVIQHARQFSSAHLENFARRDLTWDDLIGQGLHPRVYRLGIVRFEGKITKVRRLTATKTLREAGTQEVYEAEIVPFDNPPTEAVSFVFTELPEFLAALRQKPVEEWMDVNTDGIAAGYFFKVKQDPHTTDKVPVLIGKSLSLLKSDGSTAIKKASPSSALATIPIDKGLRVFAGIKDDARPANGSENWEEAVAWNRVLLHARRFSPEELEANAREDLRFADLFEEIRKDYSLQLVKFEGRLLMVRKVEVGPKLRAAGVETAYEGWLAPQNEPRGNPLCIIFTDPLPEGVETGRISKWVTFAGYYFKLMRYSSGEQDDKKQYVTKRAPLLLGRAIVVRPDPERPSSITWRAFATGAIAVVAGLLGISLGLTYWFRRGDKKAKDEIAAQRSKNPFAS